MILYHFPTSPFARRVRLALAHKQQPIELRDARADAAAMDQVRRLNPMQTVPVLVDGDRAIADSRVICQYLERKFPLPRLWPTGLAAVDAFRVAALCDDVIDTLANLGMRYAPLHDHANFPKVKHLFIERVQRALAELAAAVEARPQGDGFLCGDDWSMADMSVMTLVQWLEGLPLRAPSYPPAAQVVALGWALPGPLSRWAAQHAARPDVRSLG